MRYVIRDVSRGYLTQQGVACIHPRSSWYSDKLAHASEFEDVESALEIKLADETVHAVLSYDPPLTIPIQK